MDQVARLRAYLGEPIPPGGSDSDTLFTNAEITDILSASVGPTPNRRLYAAAAEGWDRKAGMFAGLVDNQVGGTNRLNSQFYDHAVKEADRYRILAYGRRATRVSPIRRAGTTIT